MAVSKAEEQTVSILFDYSLPPAEQILGFLIGWCRRVKLLEQD